MFDFDEIDVEAIYNEGRAAYVNGGVKANPYNDNARAECWARGFMDASRATKVERAA